MLPWSMELDHFLLSLEEKEITVFSLCLCRMSFQYIFFLCVLHTWESLASLENAHHISWVLPQKLTVHSESTLKTSARGSGWGWWFSCLPGYQLFTGDEFNKAKINENHFVWWPARQRRFPNGCFCHIWETTLFKKQLVRDLFTGPAKPGGLRMTSEVYLARL